MKKKFSFAAVMACSAVLSFAQTNSAAPAYPPLTVDSFAAKISGQTKPQIIDVRTPEEFEINHINDAINIDLTKNNYLEGLKQFDKSKPVFIYAIQNYRPGLLARELREKGYTEVYELKSGIANWIGAGRPYYSSAKNIVSLNEYKKLIADHRLVLVDIGTKYCGACVKVKKMVDSLKTENNNAYEILQLELYNNPRLAADLKEIQSVPTILFYKEGQLVWKKTGLTFTKEELVAEIDKVK
ncbi:MAG TPA: rhodanese-like domain-containing protein [Mucilaginibacter sp.]|nr:rhodanese-like domain-containing protein [Mucilaginibacter sp.]